MLVRNVAIALATIVLSGLGAHREPAFSPDERAAVVAFWSESGRYVVDAPDAAKKGPWQVRLTPEGSQWLWSYNHARGLGKVNPTKDATAQNPQQQVWEKWIDAKIAHDRWRAECAADLANAEFLHLPPPELPAEPEAPGVAPQDLIDLAGDPPAFAASVAPMRYTVHFGDASDAASTFVYNDQVSMRPRYAYFRFPQGVMASGVPVKQMPASDLSSLLGDAGISETEGHVMRAVSMLEGGFESINTYDTGYVSVGLIQFACGQAGGGSLGAVLLRMKTDQPDAFQSDFRKYGVDVTPTGQFDVLDPSTGAELVGSDAVRKIIEDKRLTAVFQRAGAQSRPFRIAQLRVAKDQYLPANDPIALTVNGMPVTGKIGDFIKSEAGLATLMDRKVNTGTTDPLTSVAQKFADQLKIQSIADLAPHEKEIVEAVQYRKNYLTDSSLTQPDEPVTRVFTDLTSRHGSRNGRKHSK